MSDTHKVRTCLWFHGDAEAAAEFYVGLVPGSAIENVVRPDPAQGALIVEFHLAGAPYMILAGGPHHTLTPAASIFVQVADQPETDRLWDALVADGGAESRCGWLVDRFGVSWQIIPRALPRLVGGPDPDGARRATEAMLQMSKIDVATLEAAYRGEA